MEMRDSVSDSVPLLQRPAPRGASVVSFHEPSPRVSGCQRHHRRRRRRRHHCVAYAARRGRSAAVRRAAGRRRARGGLTRGARAGGAWRRMGCGACRSPERHSSSPLQAGPFREGASSASWPTTRKRALRCWDG
eukprot:scaffold1326_cov296-Prasinococcus_capsulatus_cf.AAC.4